MDLIYVDKVLITEDVILIEILNPRISNSLSDFRGSKRKQSTKSIKS